ncbi:hypothetical protein OC846_002042 [Tilletia horrida]|uniref:F-box domain-containing protein n=1 Tax=Tilletia horrida TaxID=155126 RepID=A0AAN6GVA7_9BASI|nr:hypothetical protein OC846_002042 [Tilletia horrida]KAK0568254.1 hypothetical protein OC861_002118 [Tilletia horrida]
MGEIPRLPTEIISHIIASVVDESGTIYSASHTVTKTLLSLTLVSRATYVFASNHLRRQCMFIDDRKRLRDCVAYLKATDHLVPEYNSGKTKGTKAVPPGPQLWPITSLYLAPIAGDLIPRQTLGHIIELCTLIRPSLKRLIVDMPWQFARQPDPSIDSDALKIAFSSLTELQDLVNLTNYYPPNYSVVAPSVAYEYVGGYLPEISRWPKLRRLALLDGVPTSSLWENLRSSRALETFVFAKSSNPGYAWLKSYLGAARLEAPTAGTKPERPLKIVFAAQPQHPDMRDNGEGTARLVSAKGLVDPDNLVSFSLYEYWAPAASKPARESFEYVKAAALRDELWEWEGQTISRPGL